jgi:tetratricopeptide (TPR) repeat protein
LLCDWTRQLSSASRAKRNDAVFQPVISPETPIGRALRMIFRIRREASLFLGFERGRDDRWRDEYYFALATFGVVTAKWHAADDHLAWCLISAGVACANLSHFSWPPDPDVAPSIDAVPSYLHLLPYAHRCWRTKRPFEPVALLRRGIEKFPHAVALKQQLALSLATSQRLEDIEEARRELHPIARLACVFRDHETLCRLGRLHKDRGDDECHGHYTQAAMIADGLPAYQFYQTSLNYYRMAYEVSHAYYPAINAAAVALLVGDHETKQHLAEQTLVLCSRLPLDGDDLKWILASQGEASLLLGRTESAVKFYRSALERVLPAETGVRESMYHQLRRLAWALGQESVQPVIELFELAAPQCVFVPAPVARATGNLG